MKKSLKKIALVTFGLCADIQAASICTVLDAPGNYQFGSGIVANPTDLDDAIICITSSDVTLNLNGYAYMQDPTNSLAGLTGIRVAPNLKNVTIQNGLIRQLTGPGITIGEGCSDIIIQNVETTDCDAAGILIQGVMGNPVVNALIKDSFVISCTGADLNTAYGIRVTYGGNVEINDCRIIGNDAGTVAAGFGISIENSQSCKLERCLCVSNGGQGTACGISIFLSSGVRVINCSAANTVARGGTSEACGFSSNQCSNSLFADCFAARNSNTQDRAYGFKFVDGGDNSALFCTALSNAGTTTAAGFLVEDTESRSSLFKCKSRANDAGISGEGYGILVDGPQNCDFWFNELVGNRGATAYGLRDMTASSNNLVTGNAAFRNTTSAFLGVAANTIITAAVNDFTALSSIKYMNVAFTQ
jgi:hypothetical protein